jgi:hypothetical protein
MVTGYSDSHYYPPRDFDVALADNAKQAALIDQGGLLFYRGDESWLIGVMKVVIEEINFYWLSV